MSTFFVTGTDTDVGKTVASTLMLQALNKQNYSTLGIKPISAGCIKTPDGLKNDDALALQGASSIDAAYSIINPITFEPAIAPHIAAIELNSEVNLVDLQICLENAKALKPQHLLVEGAGGWRLPLNNQGVFFSDFALQNQMKVILVVGMKLGCLNHAVLTYQSIVNDGLDCVGWIANQIDPDMPYIEQNIDSLQALLPSPMLARIPYQDQIDTITLNDAFSDVFV